MKRHSRAHVRHHRERVIARWRRLLPQISGYDWYSSLPDGRFNKHTESCDCQTCLLERASRKFRTRKKSLYCRMDRVEAAAYDTPEAAC